MSEKYVVVTSSVDATDVIHHLEAAGVVSVLKMHTKGNRTLFSVATNLTRDELVNQSRLEDDIRVTQSEFEDEVYGFCHFQSATTTTSDLATAAAQNTDNDVVMQIQIGNTNLGLE